MILLLLHTRITTSVVGDSSSQAANYQYSSFNNSVSSLDCIVSNERMMTENFELGKMQKEMIVL
jgi:hypothetical protein